MSKKTIKKEGKFELVKNTPTGFDWSSYQIYVNKKLTYSSSSLKEAQQEFKRMTEFEKVYSDFLSGLDTLKRRK
jgi:hypothetical protein